MTTYLHNELNLKTVPCEVTQYGRSYIRCHCSWFIDKPNKINAALIIAWMHQNSSYLSQESWSCALIPHITIHYIYLQTVMFKTVISYKVCEYIKKHFSAFSSYTVHDLYMYVVTKLFWPIVIGLTKGLQCEEHDWQQHISWQWEI
jgi:hypothetical protein